MGVFKLSFLVYVPFAAGVLCLLMPKARAVRTAVALATAAAAVIWSGIAAWPVLLSKRGPVPPGPGTILQFRLDGLSAFILFAATIFALLVTIYSTGFMRNRERLNEYYAYLLWTLGAACGAILANDLILLFVFWGILGLTLYLLIGIAGAQAAATAKKTFIIIGGSDCLLLLGIALFWMLTGSTRMDQAPLAFVEGNVSIAFLCFIAAAFAKAGAMPFHTWVPDCGADADITVTAFLPASLDKLLGIYLLTRTATTMFQLNGTMSNLLMFVGAATIICAVMMALIQHDMKRLLSYHAVSQVGYMILGVGTGIPIGIAGGLFHMLNNAVYKSCLFLCAGSVEKQAGSTDMDRLGGLARAMPITFGACFVAALSISGIPPLNGFSSKWMVYQGIVQSSRSGGFMWVIWLAAAMLGSALTLASFAKVLHAVFLRKPSPEIEKKNVREVNPVLWIPCVLLAAACILFGVFDQALPLKFFIIPATDMLGLPVTFPGTWLASSATIMLCCALAAGLVLYILTNVRGARQCDSFIGGEILNETYVSGKEDESADLEVTGVDFYRTIQEMTPFSSIYAAAEKKFFDIYDVGTGILFYFVELFRKAHTGALPMYLTWVLVGLIVLLAVISGGP